MSEMDPLPMLFAVCREHKRSINTLNFLFDFGDILEDHMLISQEMKGIACGWTCCSYKGLRNPAI